MRISGVSKVNHRINMHQDTISQIVAEIGPMLKGRYLGRIFQLGPFSLAIDFGLGGGSYLFISAEPAAPRLYLIKRKVKDLEKEAVPHSHFAQLLRANLSGAELLEVTKETTERVVRFLFRRKDELGGTEKNELVAQLTGKSANLFLLDASEHIRAVLRTARDSEQVPDAKYDLPAPHTRPHAERESLTQGNFETLSAALDAHYQNLSAERDFQQRVKKLQSGINRALQQKAKLRRNLEQDLTAHGDAETHKRLGDLLLANLATARREGSTVRIKDYYADGAPLILLELDENISLPEHANRFFSRYGKAKRAAEEITRRLKEIAREVEALKVKESLLKRIEEARDEEALQDFEEPQKPSKTARGNRAEAVKIPGVRSYQSSDGYEILVGRRAADNDHLTFRLAKPNDLWLHSADYPGSHVIVRRIGRKEIPQRTVIEAAKLAARFSQARKDSKVSVHYTPRKFLSKPKGAAPGLVRMSSFKTMLVEPTAD